MLRSSDVAATVPLLRERAATLTARAGRLAAQAPDAGQAAGPVEDLQVAALQALRGTASALTALADDLARAAERADAADRTVAARLARLRGGHRDAGGDGG